MGWYTDCHLWLWAYSYLLLCTNLTSLRIIFCCGFLLVHSLSFRHLSVVDDCVCWNSQSTQVINLFLHYCHLFRSLQTYNGSVLMSVIQKMWRRKWQPTPVFLPGESQGWESLVGCHPRGRTESDTTEVTWQQQQYRKWIEKEMQEGKVVVWGCFADSWGKKRSKRQGRKGKTYPNECRVSEDSQEEIRKPS